MFDFTITQNRTVRLSALSLLVCVAIGATSAQAQLNGEETEPVAEPVVPTTADVTAERMATARLLLSPFHGISSAADFESQLGDARPVLWTIVRDADQPAFIQDRALLALAYWPTPELHDFLVTLLPASTPDNEMRRHLAIELLSRAWGEAELPTLLPLLQDSNVQIRLSVVHALDSLGTTTAMDALRSARAGETNRVVAAEMDDALGN
jgi:hypothetical protein